MLAADKGQTSVMELLLEHHAQVNVKNKVRYARLYTKQPIHRRDMCCMVLCCFDFVERSHGADAGV